jgi:hypothetical protein
MKFKGRLLINDIIEPPSQTYVQHPCFSFSFKERWWCADFKQMNSVKKRKTSYPLYHINDCINAPKATK